MNLKSCFNNVYILKLLNTEKNSDFNIAIVTKIVIFSDNQEIFGYEDGSDAHVSASDYLARMRYMY